MNTILTRRGIAMPHRTFAGQTVEVSEEGYFTNPTQWSETVAEELAREAGIDLTPRHKAVLTFLRDRYAEGAPLTIRRVGKSGIVTIKEFYDLFPGGPLKVSSKIAGIPKPVSCV
jgi:tRNA 2-thiouridine synthesizing protein E